MATREQVLRLVRDENALLSLIGAYTVAAAQRAFVEQRSPQGDPWPKRYPNQGEPFLNVAGAIEDLKTAARIKSRRYEDGPVGRDTGDLLGRITYGVGSGEVAIGSNVPYAKKFQDGGESEQVLDNQTIRNLITVLRKKRNAERRAASRAGRSRQNTVEEQRLGPVLGAYRRGDRTWKTESPSRPFVQLGEQDSDDLAEQILIAAEQY